MKRIIYLFWGLFFLVACNPNKDRTPYEKKIYHYRTEKDKMFRTTLQSPLSEEQKLVFSSLDYFEVDSSYRIRAHFKKFKEPDVVKMAYSTGKDKPYLRYAKLGFNLNDRHLKLIAYQSMELSGKPGHQDDLFVPFHDATNGKTTYKGGRYLEIKKPAGDSVTLDFNRAYNPYCAYNDRYKCPVPPADNQLSVQVKAGEKKYK